MQQMQLWPSQLHWQSPSHSALVQVEMPSACSTTLTMAKLRELMAGKRLFLLLFCHVMTLDDALSVFQVDILLKL